MTTTLQEQNRRVMIHNNNLKICLRLDDVLQSLRRTAFENASAYKYFATEREEEDLIRKMGVVKGEEF